MKATLKKHPELDFFIGFMGGEEIPTKQDKFKPLNGYQLIIEEDGKKINLSDEHDLYLKKKGKQNIQEFEEKFRILIKENLTEEHPYDIDTKLEVIVSVSMDAKRIKEVDIDNLIKSVLDCFNGLVFVDDSQILNVLGQKNIHPIGDINGLIVGVRKIKNGEDSWFGNIKLAYFEYEE